MSTIEHLSSTELTVYRVDWSESEYEPGFGHTVRSDGYSVHLSLDDVKKHIQGVRSRLPKELPAEYDFPGNGWREPVPATPIVINGATVLSAELAEKGSAWVSRSYSDDERGQRYQEVHSAKKTGAPIKVSFSEAGYTEDEKRLMAIRDLAAQMPNEEEAVRFSRAAVARSALTQKPG